MTQYVNKDALVAEIRKRLLPVIRDKHYDEWEEGQDSERIAILDIIDTLKVKKEIETKLLPSKKQLKALKDLLDYNIGVFDYQKFMEVNSLYDELKKLTED